jgi:DNA-binding response OmpR family regulator
MRDPALGRALKEIDHLKAELAYLRSEFGLDLMAPAKFGFTPQEGRVFCALYKRERCTRGALLAAMRHNLRDEPTNGAISVCLFKVRRKAARFGMQIATVWGQGYAMPPASKAIARQAFEEAANV